MLLAEEIRGLVKTVLSQDDLLLFERALESVPEVYNYSGVMTDEQLNHLIAFLSRSKENIFFELKHAKEEHAKIVAEKDRCLAEKDEALRDKDAELTKKDRVIRSKDTVIAKTLLHGPDFELLRPLHGRLVHVLQGWKISDKQQLGRTSGPTIYCVAKSYTTLRK